MNAYRKTIVAVVGAVIAWLTIVTQSPAGPISAAEWLAGLVLLATALGVYGTSNEPS